VSWRWLGITKTSFAVGMEQNHRFKT
jgi:hypothetical protein